MNDPEHEIEASPTDIEMHTDRRPKDVERRVLSISSRSTATDLAEAINEADWLLCRARSINNLCKQVAIDWIEHNGDLTVGTIRYHVGYSTTTKCLDAKRCGVTLLDQLGGDIDGFLDALVAQPYKPAHVRNILDQTIYRSLFATQSVGRLINGVPERTLTRSDTRFTVPSPRSLASKEKR